VTVQSVKERELPELDDDFAQLASEFDTLEELRADVVRQVEQAKRFEQGVQARDKVLERLLDATDVPIPEGIVEAEVHSHLEGEDRLEDDEHRAEVDESTRKALRAQLLLDAIVEKEEIRVEQPELVDYIVMSAQQYGMDPNQFAQSIDQQGQVPAMVAEVARRKALANVLEQASVVDTNGTAIDLDQAVPQAEAGASPTDVDTDAADESAFDENAGARA
jgi:trigger factor